VLNDGSQVAGNLFTTGEVDLRVPYTASYTDSSNGKTVEASGVVDGDSEGGLDVPAVSPCDEGRVVLCPEVVGNPAYLWLCGAVRKDAENGKPDPEGGATGSRQDAENGTTGPGQDAVPADGPRGELGTALKAELAYVAPSGDDRVVLSKGSFARVVGTLRYGVPLDADPNYDATGTRTFAAPGEQACFDDSGRPCVELDWWVPEEVGNTIASDEFAFELGLHAYQCRHEDGTRNPCAPTRAISFVAFCVDDDEELSASDVWFTVTGWNGDGEPIALEWTSSTPLETVVLYYAGVFENRYVDGATSGTVTVGSGHVRLPYHPTGSPALENGQAPSDPCPDGETGIKYEYDGGEFVRDS